MIRRGLVASFACLIATLAIWFWAASHVDPTATVPVHWGPNGPDRFGSGAEAVRILALFPAILAGVALLMAVAPRIEPFRRNLQMGARLYLISWIGVDLLIVATTFVIARQMTLPVGDYSDLWVRGIVAGSFLLIVATADSMPKTRRNFLLGVRTRWTLTSDLSWEKTQRLAGRLLMLVGLWGVAAAFLFDLKHMIWMITVPLLVVVVICCVYSYFVWRADPIQGPNKTLGDIDHA
ncbi:SdpI family protein [Roseiterribacter gracilis]|uniref:Hemolysin expression modulating protein n=1 Tax=Roseiterribacter gracilis TaxID=2812848 RepID=A0A8S8XA88_9PROT|nr:hemolysin expression modulating protein [Rhodospirillales bacterium TMPK1]